MELGGGVGTVFRRIALVAFAVVLAMGGSLRVPSPASGVAGFGDVPEAVFYTEAVQWMADEAITTGTSETCFSPNDPVTRGQAAAFMWRMEGEQSAEPHPFDDVVASWQQAPVSWMYEKGITTGTTNETYSPDDTLTRGQLAALLWRLEGGPTSSPHPFDDVVASWQQGPVSWMASTDPVITTGTSATTFSPDDPVTRGQLATFFWRYKGEPPAPVSASHPTDPGCAQQVGGPTEDLLSAEAVQPGGSLRVSAGGFGAGESVRIELHSIPVLLETVVADSTGSIDLEVAVPSATAPGDHEIVVVGPGPDSTPVEYRTGIVVDSDGPTFAEVGVSSSLVGPGDSLTISIRALDETGVSRVGFSFTLDGAQRDICGQTTSLASGDASDGVWTYTCTIPGSVQNGTYTVVPYGEDVVGNFTNTNCCSSSPTRATFTVE